MIRIEGSSNASAKRYARSNASQQDHFVTTMSIGLLVAVVLVCGVMVAVPLLTAILG